MNDPKTTRYACRPPSGYIFPSRSLDRPSGSGNWGFGVLLFSGGWDESDILFGCFSISTTLLSLLLSLSLSSSSMAPVPERTFSASINPLPLFHSPLDFSSVSTSHICCSPDVAKPAR
ncbi:hypothetical protein I7I53_04829 [Histoplasma capsulatum var. duboisii H88]|uniref:Uncharacterized protein n=1 Tax=Ajellomyces capsulatus (strain H88) TaxID=544711 RepID=A0A8A1LRB0_AJEC8|nr:hypothetical protein I7I53_04829 [Histoplasma capsulatum var. duboisii H88]